MTPQRAATSIRPLGPIALAAVLAFSLTPSIGAQDRLRSMPGYERFQSICQQISGSVRGGALSVTWHGDSTAFEFSRDGKRYRYDVARRAAVETGPSADGASSAGRARPERGRQYDSAESPDGKWRAFYRKRNLWVSERQGNQEFAITTDGDESTRVKSGTASWVQ